MPKRTAPGTPPPALEFGVGIPKAPTPSLGGPMTDIAGGAEAFIEQFRQARSEKELQAMRQAQQELGQEELTERRAGREQRATEAQAQRDFDEDQKVLDREARQKIAETAARGSVSGQSLQERLRIEREKNATDAIETSVQLDLSQGRDARSFRDFKAQHSDELTDDQIRTAMRDGKLNLIKGVDALDQQLLEGLGGQVGDLDLGEGRAPAEVGAAAPGVPPAIVEIVAGLTTEQRLAVADIVETLEAQGMDQVEAFRLAVTQVMGAAAPASPGALPDPSRTLTPGPAAPQLDVTQLVPGLTRQ